MSATEPVLAPISGVNGGTLRQSSCFSRRGAPKPTSAVALTLLVPLIARALRSTELRRLPIRYRRSEVLSLLRSLQPSFSSVFFNGVRATFPSALLYQFVSSAREAFSAPLVL